MLENEKKKNQLGNKKNFGKKKKPGKVPHVAPCLTLRLSRGKKGGMKNATSSTSRRRIQGIKGNYERGQRGRGREINPQEVPRREEITGR